MILIIDFTCGREESHSWDSLVKFQQEIQSSLRVPTVVCIPRSATFEQKQHKNLKLLDTNPFKDLLSGKLNSMNFFQFMRATMKVFLEIQRLLQSQKVKNIVWVNADSSSLLVSYLLSYFRGEITYHLRFIGWPEFWAPFDSKMLKFLVKIADKRKNISLAFETSSLKSYLGSSGIVVPYPISEFPVMKEKSRTIYLVGSARREKGFDQMPSFAESLAIHLPEYKLVLQQSTNPWDGYANTLDKLRQMKNVVLLPAFLKRDEFDTVLNSSALTIMPYEPSSYALRGSAALFESVERSIPVVTYSAVAFADDIVRFHLGLVASGPNDLIRCVRQVVSSSIQSIGFEAYRNYSKLQLNNWIRHYR